MHSSIWFCYRVLSLIRHTLDQSPLQTDVLRSLDSFFHTFPTAMDLFHYVDSGKDNYSKGFQSVGLSTNPSLLSNLDVDTSNTLIYFFKNFSRKMPENIFSIITSTLKELGIKETGITAALKDIYQTTLAESSSGCLLQFFIDPDVLDMATYPSVSMGATLKDANGPLKSAQAVLDAMRAGKTISTTKVDEIQLRLHAYLNRFRADQVVVKDYFSFDGINIAEIDTQIQEAIQPHLEHFLEGVLKSSSIYNTKPALVKIAQHHNLNNPWEFKKEQHPLVKAVKDEAPYDTIFNLMAEYPDINSITYVVPDTLIVIHITNFEIIQALINLGDDYEIVTQCLEKNRLISDDMYNFQVAKMLNTVHELGDERQTIVQCVIENALIWDEMSASNLCCIMKAVHKLGDDRQAVIKCVKNNGLITEKTSPWYIPDILAAVRGLGDDRHAVVQSIKKDGLITDKSEDKEIEKILSAYGMLGSRRDEVIKFVKNNRLISDKMDSTEISGILYAIKRFSFDRLNKILYIKKNGLISDMMSGRCVVRVLDAVNELGAKYESIMQFVINNGLISDQMHGQEIADLLEAIYWLGPKSEEIVQRVKNNELISDQMRGPEIANILIKKDKKRVRYVYF